MGDDDEKVGKVGVDNPVRCLDLLLATTELDEEVDDENDSSFPLVLATVGIECWGEVSNGLLLRLAKLCLLLDRTDRGVRR